MNIKPHTEGMFALTLNRKREKFSLRIHDHKHPFIWDLVRYLTVCVMGKNLSFHSKGSLIDVPQMANFD